jgi:hypothetical protein
MEFYATPAAPPTIPAGAWQLRKMVAGTPTIVSFGNMDTYDLNVNYFWRVVVVRSGANLVVRVYQDENLISDKLTAYTPWTNPKGKVEIAAQANCTMTISDVEVHPYPMDEEFVGP